MYKAFLLVALVAAKPHAQGGTPPEKLARGQSCLECHQGLTESHNSHAPDRDGKCALCHLQVAPEKHAFSAPKEPGKVCITCHVLPPRTATHAPVAKQDCRACHTAHPNASEPYRRNMLRLPSEGALCLSCHAESGGQGHAFVHGPVAAGACMLCHVPHSSEEKKLLRKPANTTCLDCHADVHSRLESGVSRHPPVLEGCTLCHEAHASDQRFQLQKEPKKLCLDCHATLLADFEKRPVFHQALVTNEGCANCHAAHASPFPKLLEKPVGELCLGCHSKPIDRPDGRTIAPVGHEIAGAKFVHGPIREGACDACHDPHGSATFSLLREPYPKEFYAPFRPENYGLCFRCHEGQAFTAEKTDAFTRFRDGTKNLHFLHVNRDKGRTCRACHATHASDLPVHLAKDVPFGNWAMPIQFERLSDGGACTPGCHTRQEYHFDPRSNPPRKQP
jgi:predicted CXXCH cytochrome family protein